MTSDAITPAELVDQRLPTGRCGACQHRGLTVNREFVALRLDAHDGFENVHRADLWPDAVVTVALASCPHCGLVMFLLKDLPDEPTDESLPAHG